MSDLPTCIQCGGKEFFIESGFYFCAECQIQSQDIREQVLLHNYQGGTQARTTNVTTPSQRKSQTTTLSEGPELTSWEVLNYVLKGWVDELMRLGVDTRVKVVALQLWVAYLRKLEVAFISTLIQKKPRLGFTYRARDAELVYGASNTQAKALKQPFSSRSSASSQASSSYGSSRFRSKKRKELATALYKEESVVSDTSRSNISLENLSASSPGSTKSTKMCYTVHAKKTLSKLFGSLESLPDVQHRETTFRNAQTSEKKSLRHLNALSVFSLLRLALLICRSPVQLSDIFRWSREGYLSLRDMERLLPPSVSVTKDIKALLVNPINSWASVTKKLHHLSKFLGVTNLNVDLLPIIEKLAQELLLPDDLMDIARKLYFMAKPNSNISSTINYEGRAVSFIIFILKVVFSLDGRTEIFNSRSAILINKCLQNRSNNEKRLFIWTEWAEIVEYQHAVVSNYHIPSRELWYPGGEWPETIPAFLGQWSVAPKRQIVRRVEEVKPNIAIALNRILGPLTCDGVEPPKPSLASSRSLVEHAVSLAQPNVGTKLTSLLESSSKYSISVYFDTDRLTTLAEENGVNISYNLPTDFCRVPKYRCSKIKPFSSSLRQPITAYLSGDLMTSESDSDSTYKLEDDPDDPDFKLSLNRKRKKIKTDKSAKIEMELLSDKSFNLGHSIEKTNFSKMDILPVPNGSIASKINLYDMFEEKKDDFSKDTLYLTHDNYWRLEGSFYNDSLSIEEFEEFARVSFAPSFFWLLQKCSKLINQSMRDVYRQLLLLEEVYVKKADMFNMSRKGFWKKW